MTPRLVAVMLDGNVQTGSQLPRPRVGDIATHHVGFTEATEHTDPADPTVATFTVRVEPLDDGRPRRNPRYDGTAHQRWPRWVSILHADGWAACWVSFRPPPEQPGPVELRGRLTSDFPALCPCWIRGRITRLWITAARYDRPADPHDPATWEPAWGSHHRIAIDQQPVRGSGPPMPKLPTGTTYTGMLAELDLDDVPDGRTGGVHRHPTSVPDPSADPSAQPPPSGTGEGMTAGMTAGSDTTRPR